MPSKTAFQQSFDRAVEHLSVGNLASASISYRECTQIDPQSFEAWHALGMTLMKLGNYREAIGCGLQATTLKPNDLLAWTALSQMYVQDNQIAEAETAKANARILSLGGRVQRD